MTCIDDRRLHTRQTADEHRITSARIRPGHPAIVIDVSEGGALIETSKRLFPGSIVDVQFNTIQQQSAVRARVLRCSVTELQPHAVSYRAAISFEYRVPTSECAPASSGGVTPSQNAV